MRGSHGAVGNEYINFGAFIYHLLCYRSLIFLQSSVPVVRIVATDFFSLDNTCVSGADIELLIFLEGATTVYRYPSAISSCLCKSRTSGRGPIHPNGESFKGAQGTMSVFRPNSTPLLTVKQQWPDSNLLLAVMAKKKLPTVALVWRISWLPFTWYQLIKTVRCSCNILLETQFLH